MDFKANITLFLVLFSMKVLGFGDLFGARNAPRLVVYAYEPDMTGNLAEECFNCRVMCQKLSRRKQERKLQKIRADAGRPLK